MKGSTIVCFANYLQNDPGLLRRRELSDFVKVDIETSKRWLNKTQEPVGEPLIRLRYFLQSKGYIVSEIEKLDARIAHLGRLFADGELNIDQLVRLLDYDGEGARSNVLAVLRGSRGLSPARFEMVEKFLAERKCTEPNVSAPKARPRTTSESHATIIDALAASVNTMLPLAEHVLSDAFTAEERERVREMTKGGVSRLSHMLTQLTGEAVRSALATKQQ